MGVGNDIAQKIGSLGGTGINEGQPGPIGQSIVEGGFQLGFSLLGSGLAKQFDNPALAKSTEKAGENIVQTLRNEWYGKQAENFKNIHGKRYMNEMQRLQSDYKRKTELHSVDAVDPETGEPIKVQGFIPVDHEGVPTPGDIIRADSTEAFQHLQKAAEEFYGETGKLSMEFLNAAGEYPDNPVINGLAQNVMSFFSKQAGYAATGRQEASEQLNFMNEQESGRVARATDQENYLAQVTSRKTREIAMQSAQQEAQVEAASSEEFRDILDRAGLPKNPKDWKGDQGLQAAALLKRVRQEESRQAELLNRDKTRSIFRPIIPPSTPFENVADVIKTTKLYENSAEVAVGDLSSQVRSRVVANPEFQKELMNYIDPGDKEKAIQTKIEQFLSTPEARSEIQRLALKDSMTKTYALDSGFRARVDSETQRRINTGDWKRYEGEPNIDVFMEHEYPNLLPLNPVTGKPFANRGAYLDYKDRIEEERRKAVEAEASRTIKEENEVKAKKRFTFTAEGEAEGVRQWRNVQSKIDNINSILTYTKVPLEERRKFTNLINRLRKLQSKYPSPGGSLLRRAGELFKIEEMPAQREQAMEEAEVLLKGER